MVEIVSVSFQFSKLLAMSPENSTHSGDVLRHQIIREIMSKLGRDFDGKRLFSRSKPMPVLKAPPSVSSPESSTVVSVDEVPSKSGSVPQANAGKRKAPSTDYAGLPPPPDPRASSSMIFLRPLSVKLKIVPECPPGTF